MTPVAGGNASQVYTDLQNLGLPAGAAAGIVGNLVVESNVNPGAVGDNGTSYGIAQWHNERWTRLKAFAAKLGKPASDLRTQEAYLVAEMKSSGLWSKLQNTPDAATAATLVMTDYERPASKDPTARIRAALGVQGGSAAVSGTGGASALNVGLPNVTGGSWTDALTAGLRSTGLTLAGAALGLALVGVGVVTVAKGTRSAT